MGGGGEEGGGFSYKTKGTVLVFSWCGFRFIIMPRKDQERERERGRERERERERNEEE